MHRRIRSGLLAATFLSLPLFAAVTGTIVRPDGEPIAGVTVEGRVPVPPQEMIHAATVAPLATAVTGDDGTFTLKLDRTGLLRLHVQQDGYAPLDAIVAADEPAGTFALQPAPMARGKVTAAGKPVANALVYFWSMQGMSWFTRSGEDGTYRVPDPKEWAQSSFALHPDFAPAVQLGTDTNFRLDAGKEIKGHVVDANGRAVPNATVDLNQTAKATTNAEGAFTFPHALRDQVFITAQAPGGKASAMAGSGSPTLKLQPTTRVTGFVRDAAKRPLAGITVYMIGNEARSSHFNEGAGDTTVSDAKGAFTFDVPAGNYELVIEGASIFEAEPIEIEVARTAVAKTIVAERLKPIDVTVRTADDKPVAAASLHYIYTDATIGSTMAQPANAITDRDGKARVRVSIDESMKLRLAAMKAGLPPATSDPLTAKTTAVAIKVPQGIAVRGVVTGPDDKPVAGVRINPILGSMPNTELASRDAWAKTDEEGRFTVPLMTGPIALSFAKTGFVAVQEGVDVQDPTAPLAVKLVPTTSISGRVVNADGTPAADIMVNASDQTVTTDADGAFVLDNLQAGSQTIQFGRQRFKQQAVNAPARNITLTLDAVRTIRGRVVSAAGAPIDNFSIAAGDATSSYAPTVPFEGANGEFEIEAPFENAKLTASATGFVPTEVVLEATVAQPLVITLSRGRTIRGHVKNEKGEPLSGVAVTSGGREYSMHGEETPNVQSSADGSFEIAGIPPDARSTLSFAKSGFVKAQRNVEPGSDDTTVDVTMRPGIALKGRVVDAGGGAVKQVSVTAQSASHGAGYESASTDESGAFVFESLAPGRYDFEAERSEDAKRGEVKDVDVAKTRELVIRLEATPTAVIYGRVTGLDNTAMGRFVMASNQDGAMQRTVVDPTGNFRMPNAPVGAVDVQAWSMSAQGSRQSKKIALNLAAGSETKVDIAFERQVTIRGRVTRRGAPLAGALVGMGMNSATTEATGNYEASVDPGEVDISISMNGKSLPFAQTITATAGGQFDFDVDTISLTVRALDAATGQSIAGAAVTAAQHGQTHGYEPSITSSDGAATLELPRGSTMTVSASKLGYANAAEDITPADNQVITLRLGRSAGARVRIADRRDGRTLTGYVIARDTSGRIVASANETDPDGVVRLPLAEGKYLFSASAEGFGSQTVAAEVPGNEVRIDLPRGGNLSLRASRDIRGTARLIQANGEEYVRCWCNGIAEIKIEGPSTLIDRVSPGAYTLELNLTNDKPRRIPVTVVEGQTVPVQID